MAITTTSVASFVNNQINAYRGLAQKATGTGETVDQNNSVVAALKQFFYKLDFLLKYGHFPSVEDTENTLPKELRELKTFLENPQNAGERYILQKDANTRYCFTYADIGTITVAEESRSWEQDRGNTPGKLGAWTESGEFVWQEVQSSQSCDLNAFLIETLQDTKRADILDSLKTIKARLPSCSDRLVFTTVSESMTTCRLPPSLAENLDVDLIIAEDQNNQVAGYLRHKGVDLKIDENTLVSVFRSQADGIQYTSSPKLFLWHGNGDEISERDVDKFFPLNFKGRQLAITAALNAPYKYINMYSTAGNENYSQFKSLYLDLARARSIHLFLNGIDVSSHMEQIQSELIKDIDDYSNAPAIKPLSSDSVAHLMSHLDDDEMLDNSRKATIQNILNQPQFASAMAIATNQMFGNAMLNPMVQFQARSLHYLGDVSASDKRAAELKGTKPTLDWSRIRKDELYVYINMNDDSSKLAVKSTNIWPFFAPEGICAIANSTIFDVTSDYAEATLDMMNQVLKPTITGCIATS